MRLALAIIAFSLLTGCTNSPAQGGWAASSRDAVTSLLDEPLVGYAEVSRFDRAVLFYVNHARAAHGRPLLRADPRLTRAAAEHAANMAALRKHSHLLPVAGQRRLTERMNRQGIRYRIAGENIAMEKVYRLTGRPIAIEVKGCHFTYADTQQLVPPHSITSLAETAVARWMASPKHRASILRWDFRHTGSGFGVDPAGSACGDIYLAQTFTG